MGIDAVIFFKSKKEKPLLDWDLPEDVKIESAENSDLYKAKEATHQLDVPWRYYGPHYERGPWPYMVAALMILISSPDIEKVWYGGDSSDELKEVTPQYLNEISLHFMTHGNRPYRAIFETTNKKS